MQGSILFNHVFEAITSGEAFDAVVVSCDRKRGTGGKLLRLEGWMAAANKQAAMGNEQEATGNTKPATDHRQPETDHRNPNNDLHGTVTVHNPANSGHHPISIHWDLIRIFNGKRVIN